MEGFHRKLMKYWIQSFLLGVPKIIVGFRTRDGILVDVNEIQTHSIPQTVNSGPNPAWNADMCVNFAASFLECRCRDHTPCSSHHRHKVMLWLLEDRTFWLTSHCRAEGDDQRRGRMADTTDTTVSNSRSLQGGRYRARRCHIGGIQELEDQACSTAAGRGLASFDVSAFQNREFRVQFTAASRG